MNVQNQVLKYCALISLCISTAACVTLPETTATDTSLPVTEIAGYRFHAETFGKPENPVLIVLHGGPGADYQYLRNLKDLADDHFVVFYDQRGTGLSPRVPADEITLETFISDLDLFADKYSPDNAVNLLGHSWGAMLASAYTSEHPDRVANLVLAEPQFLDQSTIDSLAGGWPGLRVIWGVTKAWFSKWRVKTNGDRYAKSDYFLSRLVLLMQQPAELCNGQLPDLQANRFGTPAFEATIGRTMRDEQFAASLNFVDGIEQFSGRTLFVTGACNKLYGADFQGRHMPFFGDVRLIEIPGAGHFMFNDQPVAAMDVVRKFLAQ